MGINLKLKKKLDKKDERTNRMMNQKMELSSYEKNMKELKEIIRSRPLFGIKTKKSERDKEIPNRIKTLKDRKNTMKFVLAADLSRNIERVKKRLRNPEKISG